MQRQGLLALPGILYDSGVRNVHDLLNRIELTQHILLAVRRRCINQHPMAVTQP